MYGTPPAATLEGMLQQTDHLSALGLVEWARNTFGTGLVMSTSFGIQSAVTLHLATQAIPNIPVIWVDTGYLTPETYQYAEELTNRLKLNLHVYQSPMSPARMEALHGPLWEEEAVEALDLYDRIRKVEPMQRALQELKATAWLVGLRADQTSHRRDLRRVAAQNAMSTSRFKLFPILNWSSRDVYQYMRTHQLPQHPLWEQGYVTVGDWHSSRPLRASDEHERNTRFRGRKQECGLHTMS